MKRLTDGKGVNVVYDSVGKTTFLKGFDVLVPFGTMAIDGSASSSSFRRSRAPWRGAPRGGRR